VTSVIPDALGVSVNWSGAADRLTFVDDFHSETNVTALSSTQTSYHHNITFQAGTTFVCYKVYAGTLSGEQGCAPISAPAPAPTVDSMAPTVSITSPLNGSTVKVRSIVSVKATASDNVAVQTVDFYINGSLKCSDTTYPYECPFRLSSHAGRSYQIQATANDATGNKGSSTTVYVTSTR
jgi:hypothetical protein